MRDYVKTFCATGSLLSIAGHHSAPASKLPAVLVSLVKSYKYILCCCDCRNANLDRAETTI